VNCSTPTCPASNRLKKKWPASSVMARTSRR
jgi:hypothetical protein